MRKTYQMFFALVLCMLAATMASAQERISLKEVPFCTWSAYGIDGQATGTAECAWVLDTPTGQPYGDGNVINASDLSQYSKLIITYTEGTPRVLLNRDVEGGNANASEDAAHLIDNTVSGWSDKYFTKEDGVLTVDLKQLVKDKGYARLHAIKGANWANVTVTSMEVELSAKPIQVGWINMINNSDMEGDDVSSFFVKEYPTTSPGPATITPGVGLNNSNGIVVNSAAKVANDYDTQFWFRFNEILPVGTKYRVSFDYRADAAQSVATQSHEDPSFYIWYNLWGNVDFTTNWQTFTQEGEVTEQIGVEADHGYRFRSVAFNLSGAADNKFYFDNIKFEIYKYGTSAEFSLDVVKVDFGNDTNLPDLVKACGLPRLMYPMDCATVKVNGKAVELYSIEGFADGRFYIFLKDAIEDENSEVLVSFKNPADEKFHLLYAGGADKGKDVKDFADVVASLNPEIEDNEGYPYTFVTPTLLKADPEDGSFNLPNSLKEFKLVFDKNVDCEKLEATLNGKKLAVVPATGYATDITLTREGGDLPDGEYTIHVTKIFPEEMIFDTIFGDTTYTFNLGKVTADPNDVEDLAYESDFAGNGEGWIVTSDTQGEMQAANSGAGCRLMHGQNQAQGGNGFADDILYLGTRTVQGVALYGTKADKKLTLKAKNYHLTLGAAKWDGSGAARSLKVQVLTEDAVDSNTGDILDESKILVEESKALEPDFKTTTNATRIDVIVPVTVEGNYVIRLVAGNADGNAAAWGDASAVGDVKVQYLPNTIGAEWVRLLNGALEAAKKVNEKYADERYAGEVQSALAAAITKHQTEMENYTAPSVYQNAAAELESLSAKLEDHGKLCNDYDEQIKKAIDIVRQNAEKKFAGLELYAQVKELAAKYHGTSEWRNVNEDPEGEPDNQLFYEFDKLTDDAALTAAIAELKDIITVAGYLFTDGESAGTTTGVAAVFERTRVGIETLKALGVAEDDAMLVEANKALIDDDTVTGALMNRTTLELYGKLKDGVDIFKTVDPETSEETAKEYDMTVFVKNPNVYKVLPTLNYSEENIPGWTVTGSTGLWCGWNNSVKNIEGIAEDCAFTVYHAAGTAETTVTNLPAGIYKIVVDAARWDEPDPSGQTFAYYKTSATPAVEEGAEPVKDVNFAGTADLAHYGQYVMNHDNVFENVEITDGQLTLGVNFASDEGQYFFDKVKIYLTGKSASFNYALAYDAAAAGIETLDATPAAKVRAIQLFDLNGRRVAKAQKGLTIVKKVMSDGSVKTEKVIVK